MYRLNGDFALGPITELFFDRVQQHNYRLIESICPREWFRFWDSEKKQLAQLISYTI